MSKSNEPADTLAMLRMYLKHFDESGHFVDDAHEMEIKIIMFRRVAKLEAALQRTPEPAAAAVLEQPTDMPTDNKVP